MVICRMTALRKYLQRSIAHVCGSSLAHTSACRTIPLKWRELPCNPRWTRHSRVSSLPVRAMVSTGFHWRSNDCTEARSGHSALSFLVQYFLSRLRRFPVRADAWCSCIAQSVIGLHQAKKPARRPVFPNAKYYLVSIGAGVVAASPAGFSPSTGTGTTTTGAASVAGAVVVSAGAAGVISAAGAAGSVAAGVSVAGATTVSSSCWPHAARKTEATNDAINNVFFMDIPSGLIRV
jgi:hypothetical protein